MFQVDEVVSSDAGEHLVVDTAALMGHEFVAVVPFTPSWARVQGDQLLPVGPDELLLLEQLSRAKAAQGGL